MANPLVATRGLRPDRGGDKHAFWYVCPTWDKELDRIVWARRVVKCKLADLSPIAGK